MGLAEIYSDLVTILLAEKWKSLAALDAIAARDPGYLDFALKHIDMSSPADRLERIEKLAKGSCEPGLAALCAKIARVVSRIE